MRYPAVAGSFYPAEAQELGALIEECFVSSPLGPKGARATFSSLLGGMVPHAGYVYSGPCAAHFYSGVEADTACVIILGVDHRGQGWKGALSPFAWWQTPLGKVPVDRDLQRLVKSTVGFLDEDERAHALEHSIEVQLPLLQKILGGFAIVPISLSYLSAAECRELGEGVARAYEANQAAGKKTLVIASSDLSHYLPPAETEKLDRLALAPVLALDPSGLLEVVEAQNISMCGVIPTAAFLFAARSLGATRARLLKHCHSGDAVPMREVVGYASVSVEF